MKPTVAQISALQLLFDYFNEHLFNSALPPVMLNMSRKSKAMGFFAPQRWGDWTDETEEIIPSYHEISVNPECFYFGFLELCQTLVHEMCHLWQHDFGHPSRPGYHNREWADKMLEVGLVPSSTGQPGGKQTGAKMADYPDEGGRFMVMFDEIPDKMRLPFTHVKAPQKLTAKKTKTKYTCNGCDTNIWGKPGLMIDCGGCGESFEENN